jgi:hypothetical protein
VALLGPRQAGKTTLALLLARERDAMYLDLESEQDLAKRFEPKPCLADHLGRLVILDEIHRAPGLFPVLRGLIDRARRDGRRSSLYLLLGSAALDLLRQSGETLAGRVSYLELHPFDVLEVGSTAAQRDRLWLRGGFPESFLAPNDAHSLRWRQDFIRSYLERDIPPFGPRIAAERLRRFWTMLVLRQAPRPTDSRHHESQAASELPGRSGMGAGGPTHGMQATSGATRRLGRPHAIRA